jgi:uncharacterized membrane protein YgdD (TMEM256/DUF423 family)
MKEKILKTGIILAALGVALGAFGAHSLSDLLAEHGRTETYKTAVLYQFVHCIAIILTSLLYGKYESKRLNVAYYLFLGGTIIFSGSLYLLSITNIRILGAITPIGGVMFILGWIYLFLATKKPQ